MSTKKRITIGILAHVDAGKTTLSEAMLTAAGVLDRAGRVDNGDSYLDTDPQEKSRGITIFSGEARLQAGETELILVDTPGHVDFSAEMERTLAILDYAVLVVSGRELVQGHTVTIWKLLQSRDIPVFLFVNKMDLAGTDPAAAMAALKASLDEGCVAFGSMDVAVDLVEAAADSPGEKRGPDGKGKAGGQGGSAASEAAVGSPDPEELAMCDERLLDVFLAGDPLTDDLIAGAIARRKVYPCWFGSALRQQGIEGFLAGLDRYTRMPAAGEDFAARVYRISRDEKGGRLTQMKITGGALTAKDEMDTGGAAPEKIHQIRILSGQRYEMVQTAQAGQVVAVTGPEETYAGQGLGALAGDDIRARLQPVLVYALIPEEGANVPLIFQQMRQLEEEDPQLHLRWDEKRQEIQVRLMGEIQLEILQQQIRGRFGFTPAFDAGSIEYRETITDTVRGAGHFEPLRHYAEVHLRLDPLPAGSGLQLATEVSADVLDTNWQRLIMTHLGEREHPGVLTGAPLTDVQITIEGGRAHLKHTEGGDFRQATYRAIRQALRKAETAGMMQLLEPWYAFRMDLPRAQAGRAMADVQRMGGSFELQESSGSAGTDPDTVRLTGRAPVQQMRGYGAQLASYTGGYGHLSCSFSGFAPCHDTGAAMETVGYDPDRDLDNPADSVFCSHGAGRTVPWDEADEMMHVQIRDGGAAEEAEWEHEPGSITGWSGSTGHNARGNTGENRGGVAEEKELARIFERTYGRQEPRKTHKPARTIQPSAQAPARRASKPAQALPEYLLVDGYNIIFAWEELRELSQRSIDAAREALLDILGNYQGYHKCEVIVVFDAYKVKGGREHAEKQGGLTVVFTGEAQTADSYIERATYQMKQKYRVRVATSDRLEQMIILGNDAFRISAREFQAEVMETNERIREILEEHRIRAGREDKNHIKLPGHTE